MLSGNLFLNFISASLLEGIQAYFKSLNFLDYLLTIIDIAIVAFLIYYGLLLIKGTKATRIIYGIILLGIILVLGRLLRLQTLNWMLGHLTTLIIVAIPIVFQPELRRGLEKLGRAKFIRTSLFPFGPKTTLELKEILQAVKVLSQNKVGALIVIQQKTGLDDYIETGQKIDAKISSQLLLNLFYPNSPLHDGAVIIKNNRIASAGCILPLSESERAYMYGTRHRAALGLSENTDAVSIVISGETGKISLIYEGKIEEDISISILEKRLEDLIKKQ